MERKKVYEIIDEERDYQEKLTKKTFRHNKSDKSVPAEIVMMQTYLNHAIHEYTDHYGDMFALDQIRKVVAIGVRCIENHSCPRRGDDKSWRNI